MSETKKITIIELTPCADTIFSIRRDPEEGYIPASGGGMTIKTGATLRPHGLSTYAGGKATNVARVIDKLLRPEDRVEVELVVFRPDTAEGRYIGELQSQALERVQVRPILIEATARFCINVSDPSAIPPGLEFNISPRVRWRAGAEEVLIQTVSSLRTDLLILAGGPPVMEPRTGPAGELPASIIGLAGDSPQVSIDLEGTALDQSIRGRRQPDIIKINQAEYRSVESRRWEEFAGTLIVTSRDGCSVTGPGIHGPTTYVRGAVAESVYQTVGAGDATHAAFTIARWVWGFDDVRAARFGMAAAAAAVSSPDGTRGMTADRAHTIFSRLESEAIS